MMKRILTLLSIVLSYFIVKEFLILHQAATSLHPWGGWGVIILFAGGLGYFVLIPLMNILIIPARLRPARDPEHIDRVAATRVKRLRGNAKLRDLDIQIEEIAATPEGYRHIVEALRPQSDQIRKRYVTQVFYATSIAQNGFLDAVIILSTATAMMRDYFLLYQGRVSNREMVKIGRLVYLSMAIGGSEGVETATDEILSKLVSTGVKSVPFAARLFGSVADGFVNAALMTRVAMVTENYCTRLFAESDRAFYPTLHAVVSATKTVTGDLIERVTHELRKLAKDQTGSAIKAAVNPVRTVFTKAFSKSSDPGDSAEENWFDEAEKTVANPWRAMANLLHIKI